jgi:hypothetical protein
LQGITFVEAGGEIRSLSSGGCRIKRCEGAPSSAGRHRSRRSEKSSHYGLTDRRGASRVDEFLNTEGNPISSYAQTSHTSNRSLATHLFLPHNGSLVTLRIFLSNLTARSLSGIGILVADLLHRDSYMLLADFSFYSTVQAQVGLAYADMPR